MLPLKITLKNIRDKAKPFIVRVFNKDIDKKLLPLIVKVKSHEITPDLIIKPIEIFIAEIDILYAAVKPIILFKHSSSCKDSFVYYFGNVISKTKFNSYIKQGGLYFSYIAKSKNTFFKNKFSVRGLTQYFSKTRSEIYTKAKIEKSIIGLPTTLKNKLFTKTTINKNLVSLIQNYRFRKWSNDTVLFKNWQYESDNQTEITFGDTCYKEL